ncbi:phage antirepressor N-terminal domain-containing protein [Caballeronia sp. LZ008]|uniref:phage antirepressor N-terminal domain-containing protein n=1 Tax=unclassified Caballeronia TaxID=2646786 RepID=UPI00202963FB|nr:MULTISPECIES: phage antirepressor N-terminal domain-containing protein [unclassified Caballeronia]MDR5797255.1 phage antirepressor N-terminal domain-containing protein [Caballeronia sp. LZ008]
MSNASTQVVSRQIKVPFHGAELYVVEHNGEPYTPMKPIVDGMGLDWKSQHTKLTQRFASTIVEIAMVAEDGKRRLMSCMPIKKLPGWLHSINVGKIRAELRETVAAYQAECDDALWQYWMDGIAFNPRLGFSVNAGDVLTADQQETLRLMVKTLVERLPKGKQGGATIKIWSKLKSHFKVGYRQIPQSEFTEAVSIVTRTAADWEIVDEKADDDGITFKVPRYGRYVVEASSLGSYVFDARDVAFVMNRDLGEMKSEMRSLSDTLDAMRQKISDFTDDRSRPHVLRPVAIDMRVCL